MHLKMYFLSLKHIAESTELLEPYINYTEFNMFVRFLLQSVNHESNFHHTN